VFLLWFWCTDTTAVMARATKKTVHAQKAKCKTAYHHREGREQCSMKS